MSALAPGRDFFPSPRPYIYRPSVRSDWLVSCTVGHPMSNFPPFLRPAAPARRRRKGRDQPGAGSSRNRLIILVQDHWAGREWPRVNRGIAPARRQIPVRADPTRRSRRGDDPEAGERLPPDHPDQGPQGRKSRIGSGLFDDAGAGERHRHAATGRGRRPS